MATDKPSNRTPEERIGAILTRAAELDRKVHESVELDAIRAAAVLRPRHPWWRHERSRGLARRQGSGLSLEAGISLSAVDRALEE